MCHSVTTCSASTSLPSLTPTQKSWGQAMVITALVIGVLALAIHFNLDFQRAWKERVVPFLKDSRVSIPATLITVIASILCLRLVIHHSLSLSVKQVKKLHKKTTRGDLKALRELTAAAMEGNSHAQLYLGRIYYRGVIGVLLQDREVAAEWFKRAAAQGNADGRVFLGWDGVNPDKKAK